MQEEYEVNDPANLVINDDNAVPYIDENGVLKVRQRTAEELADFQRLAAENAANAVVHVGNSMRVERNKLLAETDYLVVRYQELGTPMPEIWTAYRQALRDVPSQAGFPYQIVWPEKPSI